MTVFDKKCQFLIENDDYLLTYAYFLKNKSTKVRGYVPSAKILGGKNEIKKKWPEITVFDQKCHFLTKNDDFSIKYAYFLKNKKH